MKRFLAIFLIVSCFPLPSFAETNKKDTEWFERSTRAEKWFFTDLPRHIGGDLKEGFWGPWNLMALAAGVGVTAELHQGDERIQSFFQTHRPLGNGFDQFMEIAFSAWVMDGGAAVAWGISKLGHFEKAAVEAGIFFEALALTQGITLGLKLAVQRQRPDGSNYSFPSGHAALFFAMAMVIYFYNKKWGLWFFGAAILMGLSRIIAGVHYPTDILGGAIIGTLTAWAVFYFAKKLQPFFI